MIEAMHLTEDGRYAELTSADIFRAYNIYGIPPGYQSWIESADQQMPENRNAIFTCIH
jgi:hypothetical protein